MIQKEFIIKVEKIIERGKDNWLCGIFENDKLIHSFLTEKGLVINGKVNRSYQMSACGVWKLMELLKQSKYQGKAIVFVNQNIIVDNQLKNWELKKLERSIQEWSMVSPKLLRWIYLGKAFQVARGANIDLEIKHAKTLK